MFTYLVFSSINNVIIFLHRINIISEADPDISIRGGGRFFLKKKSDFKAICFIYIFI